MYINLPASILVITSPFVIQHYDGSWYKFGSLTISHQIKIIAIDDYIGVAIRIKPICG